MNARRVRLRSEGATLVEMLIAVSIFAVAMGAMFVLFEKSYQSFHFLEQRQSIQGQVLRISNALEADFRVSHLGSVGVETRETVVGGEKVRRDLTSCLTVDDWQKASNFSSGTGIPRWNQHAVYVATLEENGKLQRIVYEPDPRVPPSPLPIQALANLDSLPSKGVRGRQVLCDNVFSWECEVDESAQLVLQTLRLRKHGAQRGLDSNKVDETFEAVFRWTPRNSVPKL